MHPEALSIVQSWVSLRHSESTVDTERGRIPWVGHTDSEIRNSLQSLRLDNTNAWKLETLMEIHRKFHSIRSIIGLARSTISAQLDIGESEDIKALTVYWRHLRSNGGKGGIATKFTRFVILSLRWIVRVLTIEQH